MCFWSRAQNIICFVCVFCSVVDSYMNTCNGRWQSIVSSVFVLICKFKNCQDVDKKFCWPSCFLVVPLLDLSLSPSLFADLFCLKICFIFFICLPHLPLKKRCEDCGRHVLMQTLVSHFAHNGTSLEQSPTFFHCWWSLQTEYSRHHKEQQNQGLVLSNVALETEHEGVYFVLSYEIPFLLMPFCIWHNLQYCSSWMKSWHMSFIS